jgi:cysteine sulfinate desulfinase/cysteine desulfurase-like protein
MGILTHGNIRMTLRAEQTEATVDKFLEELKHLVERVRA